MLFAPAGPLGGGERTEDELLRRGEHVEGERDLVLVAFALQPADQVRGVEHRGKKGTWCVFPRVFCGGWRSDCAADSGGGSGRIRREGAGGIWGDGWAEVGVWRVGV